MTIKEEVRYDKYQNELRVGDYVVVTAYNETRLGVIECFTVKMVKLSINYNTKMCDYRAYASQLIKYDRDQALINLMRAQFRN